MQTGKIPFPGHAAQLSASHPQPPGRLSLPVDSNWILGFSNPACPVKVKKMNLYFFRSEGRTVNENIGSSNVAVNVLDCAESGPFS